MEQRASTDSFSLRERIRTLGFNPEYLTPEEQVEILTLHITLQDDSREPKPAAAQERGRTWEVSGRVAPKANDRLDSASGDEKA